MYKSPSSSGGGSGLLMLLLLLWGAFYLTGCADVATSPAFEEFEEFSSSTVEPDDLELTIDPDIVMSMVADVEAELGPNPSAVALNEIQDAVGLFQMAQVEYSNGNHQQVQVLGEAARMALSRSLVSERGTDGIDDRIARIDDLRARLQAGDTQDFDRPDELVDRLGKLVDQANDARRVGNDVLAGARMVEADQRTDRSRGRQHDRDRDRGHATDVSARLAVAMANNAVRLASGLLDGRDVSERQLHLLEAAARLASAAAEALEADRFRAAAMLGHKAVNTALWAVVAPEVTEDAVRAVLEGNREMYRVLVRRYQDTLYHHALRMVGRADDAADIVQRALVNGFEKLGRCRDPEKVGGWLFRIMSNLCKDFLKSPRRDDLSIDGASATVIDRSDPSDDLERREMRAGVRQALEKLNAEQREAFVLKHLEGRSYDEMSELLGVSKPALKMRVLRAREELQSMLKVYQ